MDKRQELFHGDMVMCSDINLAVACAYDPSYMVFVLAEEPYGFPDGAPIYTVPYLLPPHSAWECYNMFHFDDFELLYYSHLNEETAQSYFAIMFAAMIKGKNVMLYVDSDEQELEDFPATLCTYVEEVFGITIGEMHECGNEYEECSFNLVFYDRIKELVLKFGYIEPEYFQNDTIDINKLNEVDTCPFTFVYDK